jgi:hypothetical protein
VGNDPIQKEHTVSTSHSRIPPLEVRERAACMCDHGSTCSSYEPGHAVHLIQARLASATPSDWIDAVVEAVDPEAGTLVLRTIADAAPILVWNGAGAARALAPGAPVALHGRYHVLADGRRRFNVLRDA